MLQPINEADDFRQGDIFILKHQQTAASEASLSTYACLLTADCDIAQNKYGDFLSILPIIPADTYIRHVWALDELKKARKKIAQKLAVDINKIIYSLSPAMSGFDEAGLIELIRNYGPQHLSSICKSGDSEQIGALNASADKIYIFSNAIDAKDDCLRLLIDYKYEDNKKFNVVNFVSQSVSPQSMRSECLFVPHMPLSRDVGFVVMLRQIIAANALSVFKNPLEGGRFNGSALGLIRVGRFNDTVRYLVAQRVASLFARIGLAEDFESDAAVAADMVASQTVEALNVTLGRTE